MTATIDLARTPVAPLREAFLASGKTAPEVATAVGWFCKGDQGDGSRVKRTLGISPESDGRCHETADYDTLWLLADAIGVQAWEVLP
jgi:hypothetical protein